MGPASEIIYLFANVAWSKAITLVDLDFEAITPATNKILLSPIEIYGSPLIGGRPITRSRWQLASTLLDSEHLEFGLWSLRFILALLYDPIERFNSDMEHRERNDLIVGGGALDL